MSKCNRTQEVVLLVFDVLVASKHNYLLFTGLVFESESSPVEQSTIHELPIVMNRFKQNMQSSDCWVTFKVLLCPCTSFYVYNLNLIINNAFHWSYIKLTRIKIILIAINALWVKK